jgi:hypothetical protein
LPEPLHESEASFKSIADWLKQLLLLGCWLFGAETCVGASSKLGLELFDASSGVNELQLAGVERVADIANVDAKLFANAAGLEGVSATAGYFGFAVIGMDIVFHDVY